VSAGEGNNFHQIVRLYFYTGTIRRPISAECAANGAAVVDDILEALSRQGKEIPVPAQKKELFYTDEDYEQKLMEAQELRKGGLMVVMRKLDLGRQK